MRSADSTPLSLHRSYVPERLAPDLLAHDLAADQLCVVLADAFDLTMDRVEELLESIPADAEVADRLGVGAGSPILMLQDTLFQADGTPFEYSRILFRGDKIQLHFTFRA